MKISPLLVLLVSGGLIHSATAADEGQPAAPNVRHLPPAHAVGGRPAVASPRLNPQTPRTLHGTPGARYFNPTPGMQAGDRTFPSNNQFQPRPQPRVITSPAATGAGSVTATTPSVPAVGAERPTNPGQNRTWTGGRNGDWRSRYNSDGSTALEDRSTRSGNGDGNWRGRNGNDSTRDGRDRHDGNHNWSGGDSRRHHDWDRGHHDRSWWRSHYTRFALFGGGYYYWNAGYWYPAYGYDPYFSTYSYDAPLFAYNDLPPGDIIASVQQELERRGYSVGGADGVYGPMTQQALLNYQHDNGLPETGEIDQPTLQSLGFE